MTDNTPAGISSAVQHQRVSALYDRLPSSVTAVAVGVLIVFFFLLPTSSSTLLKPWTAYMLSTLALRGWLWHLFRTSSVDTASARQWEWAYAGAMLATGLGWAALNGPLYPPEQNGHVFILVLTLVVAFSGMLYSSLSHTSFALFVIPTLIPGLARYIAGQGEGALLPGIIGSLGCLAVMVNLHLTLYRFAVLQLTQAAETQALLDEQQAIFQTTSAGIAVVLDRRIVKCNARLGEILGLALNDILALQSAAQLYADPDEGKAVYENSAAAFDRGKLFQSVHRLRRGNGSEFWAEMSARRMDNGTAAVWLISEVTMQPAGTDRATEPGGVNAIPPV